MAASAAIFAAVLLALASPADLRSRAEKIAIESGTQKELPGHRETLPDSVDPERSSERIGDSRETAKRQPENEINEERSYSSSGKRSNSAKSGSNVSESSASAIKYILIAALALIALMVAFAALQGRKPAIIHVTAPMPQKVAEPPIVLSDPERLLAEGAYREALHALLLSVLAALARRMALEWPRALTSREIFRRVTVVGDERSQVESLIAWVERCYFGGAPVGADELRSAIAKFRTAGLL